MAKVFERTTCSRCGGSGRYSWCRSHGDRCFRCGGSGETLTKRGRAAREFYRESLSVPVADVVPGDKIRVEVWAPGASGYKWVTVAEVKPTADISFDPTATRYDHPVPRHYRVTSEGRLPHHLTLRFDAKVLKAWDEETTARKLEEAKAYEASLTKAGKPRKRKAKSK